MFHAFGQRVGRGLGREMSLLGAVLVGFLPYALLVVLPSAFGLVGLVAAGAIGLFFWLFLEVPGVGLALLTGFGSRPGTVTVAPERGAAGPFPPGPPVPPAPPAGEPTDAPPGPAPTEEPPPSRDPER
jgi:hypothetical protein